VEAVRGAVPGADPAIDRFGAVAAASTPAALSAYDPEELTRQRSRTGAGVAADLVTILLPTLASALVDAVVAGAARWLKDKRAQPADEQTVLHLRCGGEPLRRVTFRDPDTGPEILSPPWPLSGGR
jgi:hypothetical protein